MSTIAVIFAGGVGKRMHSKDLPKQFLKIHETNNSSYCGVV